MRTIQFASGLLLACVLAAGCTRENGINTPVPPPEGGRGGKATLEVTPKHHGEDIDSGWVFIKYNTLSRPIDGGYDDTIALPHDGKMTAVFDSLKWGNYYLYAAGYDGKVMEPVAGFASFTVIDSNANTYNTIIEVTEVTGANHQ